jgi:hypothetical protein
MDLAPGTVATVTSAGTSLEDSRVSYHGTFSLAVSAAVGASKRSNGDTVVSVFTTMRAISGTPAFNKTALHLLPEDHPDWNFNTADLDFEGAYDPGAWQNASLGRPPLGKALGTADASGNIPLAAGRTYQGAVWFVLSSDDRPTHVAYSAFDAEGGTDVGEEQATWLFSMPGVMAKPPPENSAYKVVSDGAISSVTYSTVGFNQAQDSDVGASTWTKTLPNTGLKSRIIVAQAGGNSTMITCTITVNGAVVAQQTSHGAYAVVTCNSS